MTRFAATRYQPNGASLLLGAVLVGALAGCDSSASPKPGTQRPGSTAATTAGPATTTGPIATAAADVRLPPGAQFARGATSIPGEAEPVVTQFLTRAYFFATFDGHPEALYRDGTEWNRARIDDGAGFQPPAGSTLEGGSFRVVGAAANDRAMVVIGYGRERDNSRSGEFRTLPAGLIWSTRDGKAFQRIDPEDLVPNATAFRLTSVVATSHGFVVVGNALPDKLDGPGDIVVLQSADGVTWEPRTRLDGTGTLYARALYVDGDRLLIDATDQECDTTGLSYATGLRSGPAVAWSSVDAGTTWSQVDLYGPNSVLVPYGVLIEGCPVDPTLSDLVDLSKGLDTEGSIVGLARGALVARSRDGTTVSVSADLSTWSQAALPGAVPIDPDGHRPFAQALVLEVGGAVRNGSGMALLSLQDRPDGAGRPRSGGCQVAWWRSDDGGATWSTGPFGRPFTTCAGATWSFQQLLDGSVLLFANAITANSNRGEASFRVGTPGELIRWDTCVPTSGADCSFATITAPTGDANDWPDIVLAGATVTGAQLPNLNLHEANLYAALLSGTFTHADMGTVTASYVTLAGDFSRVDFTDAYLFHAIINANLTGAQLTGAELSGATWGIDAICPDGKAPTSGAIDAKAACRL